MTHWVRISHALDRSPKFNHEKLSRVLNGKVSPGVLNEIEQAVWLESFYDLMDEPGREEEAVFAELRASGGGVGFDANGSPVGFKPFEKK